MDWQVTCSLTAGLLCKLWLAATLDVAQQTSHCAYRTHGQAALTALLAVRYSVLSFSAYSFFCSMEAILLLRCVEVSKEVLRGLSVL